MQRNIGYSPVSSPEIGGNPVFNVVIAYEDYETGRHAKKTYDFLVEHLGQECQLAHQMWKFDVLGIPNLREMAAKDAAMADIVIVSLHSGGFAPEVKAWIELWLAENSHCLALVGLFDRPGDDPDQTQAARAYLASVATRGKMEFFAQPDEWPGQTRESNRLGLDNLKTLSTLAGAMEREVSFPRWGINE